MLFVISDFGPENGSPENRHRHAQTRLTCNSSVSGPLNSIIWKGRPERLARAIVKLLDVQNRHLKGIGKAKCPKKRLKNELSLV